MHPIAKLIDIFQADGGPNSSDDVRNMGAGFIVPGLLNALKVLRPMCERVEDTVLPNGKKLEALVSCRPLAIVMYNSLLFR